MKEIPLYRADKIRAAMGARGLTSTELARKAKLNPRTLRQIRTGKDAKVSTLKKVAGLLGIKTIELFEDAA